MMTCFNRCKKIRLPTFYHYVFRPSNTFDIFLYVENVCKNVFCKITLFKHAKNFMFLELFLKKFSFLKFSEKRREIYGIPELRTKEREFYK